MFRNIFLKTIRDYSRQVLIWGGGFCLLMLFYGSAYSSIFGPDVPNRAKLIEEYRQSVESFTILTGKVSDVDTLGGLISLKIGSMMPILLGIWALLAFSAIIRREEERGSMDLLSTTPHAKVSIFLQKTAGLVVSLIGIAFLSWVGLTLAAIMAKDNLNPVDGALAHLNWVLLGLFVGGLALLFSQMTSRKAAAGWAGGLMATTFLLNNAVLNVDSLQWTRYLYPYYYGSLSNGLTKSVGTNWVGITVLTGIIIPVIGLALWMYTQRDLNGFFEVIKREKPAETRVIRKIPEPKSTWITGNFTFALRASLTGVLIWGLSLAAYLLLIMSITNDIKGKMIDLINNNSFFVQIGFANLTSNETFLSLFIFLYLVLLVAAHAVIQVSSWTSEENEGRLELLLSTPTPRWRILLSYFAVSIVASALMIGIIGAIFGFSTWAFNLPVNAGNAFGAFFGLWVVCVIIEAVGYVLAAFGPAWAVSVTGGLVVISYFTDVLKDVFKIPETVSNLSVFHQYGRPLVEGLQWTPQMIMVVLSIAFIALAIIRFRQRDITK